jgi:putative folate metabolism gamma-glutamate ligase
MWVQVYKTRPVQPGDVLLSLLDFYLPLVIEKSVVVITSKIVSICQGRIVKKVSNAQREKLILTEADLYLEKKASKYGFHITITNGMFIASAGIDESNGNGYYILWPQDPQQVATEIWHHLRRKHKIKQLGVLITDSKTTPLRWGVTGIMLAHCGFEALNDYRHTPDIFGRHLHLTRANIADGLAASAVLAMGEGSEQTPLAIITDIPFVHFQNRPPTVEEIQFLKIKPKDDIYAPILNLRKFKKGAHTAGKKINK